MNQDIIYIASNFGIENIKNSHPVIIFNNFRYWWRTDNKDSSTRYVCSETNCFASIRIKQNKVVKQNGKHYHDSLTDSEIVLLKSTQDLKIEVTGDITKSIQQCYKNTQNQLVEQNVTKSMIAAKFPSFKRIANTLQKKRGKKLPAMPNAELVFDGHYATTKDKNPFLRYDSKSLDKRIIIFFYDQCLKIMRDEWFMDRSIKSLPIVNLQAENRQTLSTPSKAQFLDVLDEEPEDPHFNYVRSLMNHEILDVMSNAKKGEEERKKQITEEYSAAFNSKDIENEVKHMWRASGHESRKRISKKDRADAMCDLHKKITERVKVQLASDLLTKYGETQSYL